MRKAIDPVNRKEDYLLEVTVVADEIRIENLRCKIYLPEKQVDRVWLYFHPTVEQSRLLRNSQNSFWKFSIRAESKSGSDQIMRVQADHVYSGSMTTSHWGNDVQETVWSAEPTDLKIEFFRQYSESKTETRFWLTPSIILNPFKMIERSYTGDVKVEVSTRQKVL